DARILIDEGASAPAVPAPTEKRRLGWLPWGIAALATMAAAAAVITWLTARPEPKPMMRLTADIGIDGSLARFQLGSLLALSADGTRMAVTYRGADGKARLGTRLLYQNQVQPLSGTENAYGPFFSPDGQWIGFFADNKVKKIAVDGGAAVTLCDSVIGRGAS